MTRQEVELAALQMGEAMRTIVWAFRPDANQIEISSVNGQLAVRACVYDNDRNKTVERLLDAMLFPDGTLRLGDEYIRGDETWRRL